MESLSGTTWPGPWQPITVPQRRAYEQELQAELTAGHALMGGRATAVARCSRCDDVLFALQEAAHPYAVVHLVWQGPQRQPWPATTFFESLAELVASCAESDRES